MRWLSRQLLSRIETEPYVHPIPNKSEVFMLKKYFLGLLVTLLSIGTLVGCGSSAPTATPVPTATAVPSASADTEVITADGSRRFVIVPEESTASYIVHEEFFSGALAKYGINVGNAEVTGSTQEVSGELQLLLNDEQSEFVSGQFTVDISTLATDRSQRDGWIRDNALESNKYPIAAFTATGVEGAPATYAEGEEVSFKLTGDLLVRDITQPVTFDVTATVTGDTLTAVATTAMKISDFGFSPPSFANTLTVADDLVIRVEIVAREQKADCGCDTSLDVLAAAGT